MAVFTERGFEIASLVADGLSNTEIASRLRVSENTVRYHLKELYSRMGTSSRTTLTRHFLEGRITGRKAVG